MTDQVVNAEMDDRIAHFAAAQSVAEIGIGSAVHALRIPLGGHLLSLNQGFLLTLALRKISGRRRAIMSANAIALVAAAMKSLSPAGQRLTPMFAIAAQGAFYSLALLVFGANAVGAAAGMALLSVWGFAQPLLFAAVLFGGALFSAVEEAWRGLAEPLGIPFEFGVWILIAAVCGKALVAAALGIFSWNTDGNFETRYFARMARLRARFPKTESATDRQPAPGVAAFLDLLNPWFLVSFILTTAFIVYAGSEERRWTFFARTLGASYLLFYAVRALPPFFGPKLRGKFPRLEKIFVQALIEGAAPSRVRSRS
jgi:hypothetical protein